MRLYEPVFQFVINWGHHVKSNSMIIKVLMWENATPPCCLLLCWMGSTYSRNTYGIYHHPWKHGRLYAELLQPTFCSPGLWGIRFPQCSFRLGPPAEAPAPGGSWLGSCWALHPPTLLHTQEVRILMQEGISQTLQSKPFFAADIGKHTDWHQGCVFRHV